MIGSRSGGGAKGVPRARLAAADGRGATGPNALGRMCDPVWFEDSQYPWRWLGEFRSSVFVALCNPCCPAQIARTVRDAARVHARTD